MDKKTLNNSKMGRLVARLFGKSELDVKDGKVSEVTVGDNSETQGIGSNAIEQLPELIVEANGTEGVDGVSGATITSNAIFTAVEEALEQAQA